MSCKIYGDHSEGYQSSHPLAKISDYYASSLEKIEEMDPNLEKRKYHLHQLLSYLDEEIQEVNNVTKKLQEEIKQLFYQSLDDLESISKKKLSYLMSDQLEARRQFDYIQWMESFLRYEYKVLPPNDFIMAWTK